MKKNTNFLDRFFKWQRAPKEDAAPPPEKGAARFFFLLTANFSKLAVLNLIFLLFCLPVITIPAALSGMSRVCALLVREGVCYLWIDFFTEFKSSFFKSVPIFVAGAVFASPAFILSCLDSAGQPFILVSITVFLFIMGLLFSCYAFAMLSMCSLRLRDIFRNAFFLIFLEPKTDLLLVLFVGMTAAAFLWFLPYTLPLAFILFSLVSLISSAIVFEPIKRRVIAL